MDYKNIIVVLTYGAIAITSAHAFGTAATCPCLNGGKCVHIPAATGPGLHRHLRRQSNKCRCAKGFTGHYCGDTLNPKHNTCADDVAGLQVAYGVDVTCDVFKAMSMCALLG